MALFAIAQTFNAMNCQIACCLLCKIKPGSHCLFMTAQCPTILLNTQPLPQHALSTSLNDMECLGWTLR